MRASFKIREVRLIAAERAYEWRFDDGVNVIEGPVGVGKTSLLELIRFGLGGSARLSEAVQKVGRQLALTVEIQGERLLLVRGIVTQKSRVAVRDADGSAIATTQTGSPLAEDSLSRFLLDRLGIPVLSVPRSRAKPAGPQRRLRLHVPASDGDRPFDDQSPRRGARPEAPLDL